MGSIQGLTESGMKYYVKICVGPLSPVMMDVVQPAGGHCTSELLPLLVFLLRYLSQTPEFQLIVH